MNDPHDQQIPTVIADAPGEPVHGDYLAPPRLIPGDSLTTRRSIALLLLIGTLMYHVRGMADLLLTPAWHGGHWISQFAIGSVLLGTLLLAIFKSRAWPTYALWLAWAVVVSVLYLRILP
jgi:hypothetical protein